MCEDKHICLGYIPHNESIWLYSLVPQGHQYVQFCTGTPSDKIPAWEKDWEVLLVRTRQEKL